MEWKTRRRGGEKRPGEKRSGGRRSGLARNFQNAKTAASSITTAEGKPQLQQSHLCTDLYFLEHLFTA